MTKDDELLDERYITLIIRKSHLFIAFLTFLVIGMLIGILASGYFISKFDMSCPPETLDCVKCVDPLDTQNLTWVFCNTDIPEWCNVVDYFWLFRDKGYSGLMIDNAENNEEV